MSSRAFVSRPEGCELHAAGWLDLATGGAISRLPVVDRDMETFARLGHGPASEWATARGYRLPTANELDQLAAVDLHIDPFTMPTVEQLRNEGIAVTDHAAIQRFRVAHMMSFEWAQMHDAEVWQRLKRRGWTSEPVANAGKHWIDGGRIYGWWRKDGSRIQGASAAHRADPTFVDYATTFHVVRESMNGPRRTKSGESGDAVRAWQSWLVAKGFDPGTVDGKHGPKTESASIMYEASLGSSPARTFIRAKNYTKAGRTKVDWIVLHSTENPIRPGTARNVAQWFASSSAPQASAHYVVGPDQTIQCVNEADVAWAAPGANRQGIQIEQVGQAFKTDWTAAGVGETDGLAVLEASARLTREICDRWSIPVERLDAAGLRAGKRGITTHAAVTEAFRKGTHVDPGCKGDVRWPWDLFLERVRGA